MTPSASILEFPARRYSVIRVEREGPAWLVIVREHGWLHGSRQDALAEAGELAAIHAMPIREVRA